MDLKGSMSWQRTWKFIEHVSPITPVSRVSVWHRPGGC